MKNALTLRQIGKFYNVLDDDTYILYYLFDYKINNFKCGFPIPALNKVKNELIDRSINFIIKNKDGVEEYNFKTRNKYNVYIKKGKEKYKKELKNKELEKYVNSLSEEKIDKIYKYIESLVNEE